MKLLCLISGGIDSPVAAYLMAKKGHDLEFVHFGFQPLRYGEISEKTKKLVARLNTILKTREKSKISLGHANKVRLEKFKLTVIPHGKNLIEIMQKCDRHMTCVLCRRMMLRLACKLAKKKKCAALVTGENLGQVASQTLDNLQVETEAASLPIIRPLIGFNKQEIIDVAKKIGTYEISIQAGGCCGAVPSQPATHASLDRIKTEERKLDITALAKDSLRGSK